MLNNSDKQKDIAIDILKNELDIEPTTLLRFTTGYCHSVYYVKSELDEFVLRVTSEGNKWFYDGSVKWLSELAGLDIPIPKMLRHGQYENVYYTLITYIHGKDLGEVYHTLTDLEKQEIVSELVAIQRKVATLPVDANCCDSYLFVVNHIQRSRESIASNKIFDPSICDAVEELLGTFKKYLTEVEPTAFLSDTSTKNVLIHNGRLSGIVDIDEVDYGDPLLVVGLTNMALLAIRADTKYIDYWLDEIQANSAQRKIVVFYTLLFCVNFMGERGTTFCNGKVVPANQDEVELFNSIYVKLLAML